MLPGVLHHVGNDLRDVPVSKLVVNVFATAFADNQVFAAQHTQALGDSRERFPFCRGEFGDAGRPSGQQNDQAKTFQVADSAKHAGGHFEFAFVQGRSGEGVFVSGDE